MTLPRKTPMDCDDELPTPCLTVLSSATMALMTAWAAPCPNAGTCEQRVLIARKIVSNLFFLQYHPLASTGQRQAWSRLHREWVCIAMAAEQSAAPTQPQPGQSERLH